MELASESDEAMYAVFSKIKDVHTRVPRGITEVLELISHPDVIDTTWEWLETVYREMGSNV